MDGLGRLPAFDLSFASHCRCPALVLFAPDQRPRPVFPREFSSNFVCAVMAGHTGIKVLGLTDVKCACWILQDIYPEHGVSEVQRLR